MVQVSHFCMTPGRTIALTIWTIINKLISLLFNMPSRFVLASLPRSKCLLISCCGHGPQWSWSPRKQNLSLLPLFPHLFALKWWNWMPWSSFFECWVSSQRFHSALSPSTRGSLFPLHFLPLVWYHLHIWGYWYFSWLFWFQLVIHPACWHFTWCTLHRSWVSRVTIYSLVILLSQFGTRLFFHVWF